MHVHIIDAGTRYFVAQPHRLDRFFAAAPRHTLLQYKIRSNCIARANILSICSNYRQSAGRMADVKPLCPPGLHNSCTRWPVIAPIIPHRSACRHPYTALLSATTHHACSDIASTPLPMAPHTSRSFNIPHFHDQKQMRPYDFRRRPHLSNP